MTKYRIEKWDASRPLTTHKGTFDGRLIVISLNDDQPHAVLLVKDCGLIDLFIYKSRDKFKFGHRKMTGETSATLFNSPDYSRRNVDRGQINTLLSRPALKRHKQRIESEVLGSSGKFMTLIKETELLQRQAERKVISDVMRSNADAALLSEDDFYAQDKELGIF